MAVSMGTVNAVAYGSLGNTSRSVTVDTGATLLLVYFHTRSTIVPTATYAGNAMTLVRSNESGSIDATYLFSLINPPVGANTLAWTVSATPPGVISALPILGTDTTAPFRSQGGNNAFNFSANPSATATASLISATGDLVIAGVTVLADTDLTVTPSGGTELYQLRPTAGNTDRDSTQNAIASGSSTTLSWALSTSTHFTGIGVSLIPSSGGGTPSTTPNALLLGVG